MLQNGLHFTMVSGDEHHKIQIEKLLNLLPVKTEIEHFDACDDLMNHLEEVKYQAYQIILLDLENPIGVGMDCVRSVRKNGNFNDLVLIGYARNEEKEAVKEFFVEGGNMYFNYPKSETAIMKTFEKLVQINWQVYSTGVNRQNLVIKL